VTLAVHDVQAIGPDVRWLARTVRTSAF